METSKPGAEKQKRTFKGGIWKESYPLIAVSAVISGMMLFTGLTFNSQFPPGADFYLKLSFLYLPLAIAAAIIILTILAIRAGVIVRIIVTKELIYFQQGSRKFSSPWKDLIFAATPPDQKYPKYFTISNGKITARIHSIFFPEFDKIVKLVRNIKAEAIESEYVV